ncbi:MAG: 5'-methylthioadenosine/adenosylhomocysteine nucleosidase, partial [Trueperaceae bacterium]
MIGAMPEEIASLTPSLAEAVTVRAGPFEITAGSLEGRRVRLAVCGVGKVNAAALAQQLLSDGASRLIFTGVAGALDPELRPFDVVISRDAVQHDVDVRPLGYQVGEVPGQPLAWTADRTLADAAHAAAEAHRDDDALAAADARRARVVRGRIASGDRFVADPAERAHLHDLFGASCAEMEGAAVAQICARWGVPWVVVRSISDGADGDASVDFRTFT